MKIIVSRKGENFGPHTVDEINAFLFAGKVKTHDWAWTDDATDWVPLGSIEGIQQPAQIIVSSNGENLGPYTLGEIKILLSTGTIKADDWAWQDNMTEWVRLENIVGAGDSAQYGPSSGHPQSADTTSNLSGAKITNTERASEQVIAQMVECPSPPILQKSENRRIPEEQSTPNNTAAEEEAARKEMEVVLSEFRTQRAQDERERLLREQRKTHKPLGDAAMRRRARQEERAYLEAIRADERKAERQRRMIEQEEMKKERYSVSLLASMCSY